MSDLNGNPNAAPTTITTSSLPYSLATLAVHADDPINETTDVAPALHVSTTYRYSSNPSDLIPVSDLHVPSRAPGGPVPGDSHVYSRVTTPNTARLELMLTALLGNRPALTYSSGLAAFHALLVHLRPRVIAIGAGYHGCHGVLDIYRRLVRDSVVVDLFDDASWEAAGLGPGDVVHVETPVNPSGRAVNLAEFVRKAHARGATVTLDATFAPPPLLDPWKWGVDFVMHSGTKYFGGHSDLLCGVLAVGKGREGWEKDYWGLFADRLHLGSVMGSLEGWLGVRSLRTLELRVKRQSANAERLVAWVQGCLDGKGSEEDVRVVRATVEKLEHASLQTEDFGWLKEQMPNGFGPVFSMWMRDEETARSFPSKLHLFHHATSLGGVESLIEWRRMSDQTVDPRVERLSVGIEDWEDLQEDMRKGFRALADGREGKQNGA